MKKAFFIILDQLFYSGCNYLMSFFLFKVLGLEEYGIYAYIHTIFLFFTMLFYAAVIEPAAVVSPNKFELFKNYDYLSFYSLILYVFLFIVILIFLSFFWIPKNVNSYIVICVMGLSMLANFVLIYLKRLFVNHGLLLKSLFSSVLYCLSGFVLFFLINILDISSFDLSYKIVIGLVIIFLSSTIALIPLITNLTKGLFQINLTLPRLFSVFSYNFKLSKWMIANGLLVWMCKYFFMGYIGFTQGFSQSGVLKSLENFYLPIEQLITAVSIVVLPAAIKASNFDVAKHVIKKYSICLVLGTIAYSVFIFIFYDRIVSFLYDGNIDVLNSRILLLGLSVLTISRIIADFFWGLIFRIKRWHQLFLLTSGITFGITFFIGKWLIESFGIKGIVFLHLVIAVCQITVSSLIYVIKNYNNGKKH